jgi:hypothetical protein
MNSGTLINNNIYKGLCPPLFSKMDKRGLSQVVTTILIILIVVVAIGIIWAAVRPVIENTTTEVTADCFKLDWEVVSCTTLTDIDTTVDSDDPTDSDTTNDADGTEIVIKRNVGSGVIAGTKILIGGRVRDGPTSLNSLEELETITIKYRNAATLDPNNEAPEIVGIGVGDTVNIAPVIGEGKVCEPTSNAITCKDA